MPTDDKAAIAAILAGEQARLDAMCNRDLAALDRLLGDDFTYTHSNGSVDTKAELLARVAGPVRYADGIIIEPQVRLFGRTAVVNARFRLSVHNLGEQISLHGRILAVWAERDGRWQQIATASTPILRDAERIMNEKPAA